MNWQRINNKLHNTLAEDIYALWIQPLKCNNFDNKVIELSGPDRFFCSWVEDNYLADIKTALAEHGLQEVKVVFSVGKDIKAPKPPLNNEKVQLRLPNIPKAPTFIRTLNPRYIFDEFVVGNSNEIAHTACSALANGDTSLGQCVYINASTGLGKSHLTHAVAHHTLSYAPGTRLNYLTAQQLTAEMVKSIQTKTMENFKQKLQNCDLLLMEDVQSLTGRAKTQEELSNLFDILLESGKSIIFTGSRSPHDLGDIDPGMQSRISSGLIAKISAPDMQTRFLIIAKEAKSLSLDLSEELTTYLAEQIKGDIRQIKSAIIGLKAKTKLRRMNPDQDMVKEVLGDIIVQQQSLTPDVIRDFIAGQFKITTVDLQSKSRKKVIAFPRQLSMYFSRKYTEKGLSEIGKAFNRDHSTVVHSIRVITNAINRDGSTRGQVELLDKKLSRQFLS